MRGSTTKKERAARWPLSPVPTRLLFVFSPMHVAETISEYDCAGGLRDEPIPVFVSDLTGLPLPASAEIIVEGEMRPGDTVEEGPFGEWTGYYGAPAAQRPAIRVQGSCFAAIRFSWATPRAVRHRTTPSFAVSTFSATVWEALEGAGVTDAKGVWCHDSGGGRLFNVVAIEHMFPGHARQAESYCLPMPRSDSHGPLCRGGR